MKTKIKRFLLSQLMELFIVIIGISIAFWLNNVAIENKEDKEGITYLHDIKKDLKTDSIRLNVNIANNIKKQDKLIKLIDLIKRKSIIDSVITYTIEIGNYDFFNPDSFTLTSLIQSGDLKLIDSELTKRELLKLLKAYENIDVMQENFLDALDENYFPVLLKKVDMLEFKAIDPNFFYDYELKNYSAFALSEASRHISTYQQALQQVIKVIKLIDEELRK